MLDVNVLSTTQGRIRATAGRGGELESLTVREVYKAIYSKLLQAKKRKSFITLESLRRVLDFCVRSTQTLMYHQGT